MWSLGYVDELDWPDHMVDVDRLHELIFEAAKSPTDFIASAKLRDRATLLDTTEQVTRIHWAIRQAMVEDKPIPENLDWKQPSNLVPVGQCATVNDSL
ncbi:MAG: DUF4272 domain-containing protein [Pirellulales bacterium]|nr:DUF4272 domain-containing protein [Pirellulales bacterium]